MARVKIYTTDFCPYCIKAKNILNSKEIEYDEVNIHGEAKLRDEIEQLTGRRDVPQIFIDGKYIGDDDTLEELVASGELDKMFNVEANRNFAMSLLSAQDQRASLQHSILRAQNLNLC